MSSFDFASDAEGITCTVRPAQGGIFGRLAGRKSPNIRSVSDDDRSLAFALADLRAIAEENGEEVVISGDRIAMSHRLAALLDQATAEAFGLPPLVDLVLRTDVEGSLGSPSFRLRHDWVRHGRRQSPRREGAILHTAQGQRRIPHWMLEAVEIAESFSPGGDDIAHWESLARYRQALDPGLKVDRSDDQARVSMTNFLKGLEVQVADRFSLSPTNGTNGPDFEVIPFSGRKIDMVAAAGVQAEESMAQLAGDTLTAFQNRLRTRGALPAFRVGDGKYLVVERSAAPALRVMSDMQHATPSARAAFIANPGPLIRDAIEENLRSRGLLDGLSAENEEELVEAAAGPILVETREYSERVTGVVAYAPPVAGSDAGSGRNWFPPELFDEPAKRALQGLSSEEIATAIETVRAALDQGEAAVCIGGHDVPASPAVLRALEERRTELSLRGYAERIADPSGDGSGARMIGTKTNVEELEWCPELQPRAALIPETVPNSITTQLKQHQVESFSWQLLAWKAGLPGVLNADEQGLGKTLQTIAFLRWLKDNMAQKKGSEAGPVLVVAPTSLLKNWEQEVAVHTMEGLGHLTRLYGSALSGHKRTGSRGTETTSGELQLNLDWLHEAIREGRSHRHWLLTTYQTLTNYHHSLAKIRFAAAVFDEVQALKNHQSLRAVAARAVWSDFRIGLTGTPIENTSIDMWAIMDQLAPGALGTLHDFRQTFGTPNEENMKRLHAHVFTPERERPALAIRRLKEKVAQDLPPKTRRLHPREMPPRQAERYEDAQIKISQSGRGAALKLLHHIRGVSVHPEIEAVLPDADYISASARLSATFDILREVQRLGERALVFIEHRKMQYRFVELARTIFGLDRIDIINGATEIRKRQEIVDRFQHHLKRDGGFDLLVLGPRAAGTGLTLTAATHVIHLSRWWNPAVEEQCNDRVHRIGQSRLVSVHIPMAIHSRFAEGSFDCVLHGLMTEKRRLAKSALWPMGEVVDDGDKLRDKIAREVAHDQNMTISSAVAKMFSRDDLPEPVFRSDGSVEFN